MPAGKQGSRGEVRRGGHCSHIDRATEREGEIERAREREGERERELRGGRWGGGGQREREGGNSPPCAALVQV